MKWFWSKTARGEALKLLRKEQRQDARFRRSLYRHWQHQLDCFGVFWHLCAEVSEVRTQEGRGDGSQTVFAALAAVQPRALLVANEVRCLCECGFADGALTRWRSLHELDVVMSFVEKHGDRTAELYLRSLDAVSHKRAEAYNKWCHDLGWGAINPEQLAELEAQKIVAEAHAGFEMDGDWHWAIEVFPPKLSRVECKGKPKAYKEHRIQFAQLEKDVGLERMRPIYKWASQHTHAGMISPAATLGMSETRDPQAVQVGGSNSGISDPISLAAYSLWRSTSVFLHFSRDEATFQKEWRPINALYDELKSSILQDANQ